MISTKSAIDSSLARLRNAEGLTHVVWMRYADQAALVPYAFNRLFYRDFVWYIFLQEHAHYFSVRCADFLGNNDFEWSYFGELSCSPGGAMVGNCHAIYTRPLAGLDQLIIRHVGIN